MKKAFHSIALATLVLIGFNHLNAQDTNSDAHTLTVNIPEVALLDIEGGTAVTLNPAAPTEAGEPIDFTAETDNTLWLNYSSIIGDAPDNSRTVKANLAGTMPTGSNLIVTVGSATNTGAGNKGTSAGAVTLAAVATDYTVISGIGSCYTGNGANNGHNLTYSLTENSANYGSLNFSTDYLVTITYTLSDN